MRRENISYWTKSAQVKEFPALDEAIKSDVLVIGGGLQEFYRRMNSQILIAMSHCSTAGVLSEKQPQILQQKLQHSTDRFTKRL